LKIYADSSVFVSHYIQDRHSEKLDPRIVERPLLWCSPIHKAEIGNAIFQHVFYRKMSLDDALILWNDFEEDCAIGIWIAMDLSSRAWETSVDLARRFGPKLGVRTLDSLHVACALELKAERFWTFDERQSRLAEAVGLDTNS
jgi:predicted nucleic acid-binding protein